MLDGDEVARTIVLRGSVKNNEVSGRAVGLIFLKGDALRIEHAEIGAFRRQTHLVLVSVGPLDLEDRAGLNFERAGALPADAAYLHRAGKSQRGAADDRDRIGVGRVERAVGDGHVASETEHQQRAIISVQPPAAEIEREASGVDEHIGAGHVLQERHGAADIFLRLRGGNGILERGIEHRIRTKRELCFYLLAAVAAGAGRIAIVVTLDDGHLGQAVGRRCLAYIAVRVFEDIARCQQLPGSHSGIRRDRPECAAVERSDFAADPVHLQRDDLAAEGFQRESAVRHADGRIDVTAAGDCQAAHIAVRTDRDRAAACDAVAVQVQPNGAALSRSDRRVCGGHDAAVFDRFRSSVLQQRYGARAIPRFSRRVQRVGKADVIGGIAVRRQAGRKLRAAGTACAGRSIYILMRAGLVTVYAHAVFPVGVQTGLSAGALAVYNMVFVRQDRHVGQTRILLAVPHYSGVIGKAKGIAVRQQIRCGDTDAVIYPDYLEFAAFQFRLGRGSFRDIQLCYRHIAALHVKLSAERHLGHRPAACQRQCAVRVDRCGFIPAVPVQIERDRFVDDKAPVYVRQQLDGIAVLRIVQRTREGGICFAVHLRYAGKSRDVDSGLRLYGCVFRLMNVQRVTARRCFRIGPDKDLICAVPIVFLGHDKVRVKSVFLDIGFQRIGAGIGHGELGVSSRLDVRCLRGDRQHRFGDRLRRVARLYIAELFGSFDADRVCTVSKYCFLRRAAADRSGAVERLAGRLCFFRQRDSTRCSGDGHAAAVKVQRAAYADLRAADGAGAGNDIQTAVDCRYSTGGSMNGEHAAIDLYIAGDRAVRQRQAIRCIDAAGYAEACHINRRRGVDSNIILRDVAEQSDLDRFHLVQDLLQRVILCIADLRHTLTLGLCLDAVFFTGIHGRDAAGLVIPGRLDGHDDRIILLTAVLLVLNGRHGNGSRFRRRRRLLRRRRCRRGLVLFDFRRSRGCGRGRRRHRSVFRRCRNRQQREAQRQRQKKAQYTSFHGTTSDILKVFTDTNGGMPRSQDLSSGTRRSFCAAVLASLRRLTPSLSRM